MQLSELASKAAAALDDADAYLTSFMTQLTEQSDAPQWSLHFYSQIKDAMYTYDESSAEISGPNEVLKQSEFVPELEINNVKVSYEDAITAAYEAAKPEHDFLRVLVLLQVVDETETWNITFMNRQFHTLNVRIDAVTGKVMAREAFELFRFDEGAGQAD